MYSDENKALSLAKFLNDFDYAIIDTCSLMEDSFPVWMDTLQNAQTYLKDSGNDVCIPDECLEELKKHSENKENFDKSSAAKRALKIIKHAKRKKTLNVVKTYGNDGERHFADKAIYVKVSSDRMSKKILVITQDKKLASDLRGLNKLISQYGHPVKVYRLDARGELVPNKGETSFQEEQIFNSYNNRINSFKRDSFKNPKKDSIKENHNNLDKVKAEDAKLNAILYNNNYPDNKKIQAIEAQLKLLNSVPSEKKSNLLLNENKLNNELSILKNKYHVDTFSNKEIASKENDFASLKKTMPYGIASSLKDAISSAATYTNIMFRFHSIPYMEQFHGKIDVTDLDLNEIINLLEKGGTKNGLSAAKYKGLIVLAEPNGNGFKAWVDIEKMSEVDSKNSLADKAQANEKKNKPTDKKAEKPIHPSAAFDKKSTETTNSTQPKKKIVKVQKNKAAQSASKPKQHGKGNDEPKPSTDNFTNPKLVMLAPESKAKREKIENKVRYEDSKPFSSPNKAKNNHKENQSASKPKSSNSQPKKKVVVKKKVIKQSAKSTEKSLSSNDNSKAAFNAKNSGQKTSAAKRPEQKKSVNANKQNLKDNVDMQANASQNINNKKKVISKPKKIVRIASSKKNNPHS